MNCSFLYSNVSLWPLTGFAGGFYEFPNYTGLAYRTSFPLNIFSKYKGNSHSQRNKPQNPPEITGRQLENIRAHVCESWTVIQSQDDQSEKKQTAQCEEQLRQGHVCTSSVHSFLTASLLHMSQETNVAPKHSLQQV